MKSSASLLVDFQANPLLDWLIDWVLCVGDWLIDWLIGFCASAIGWLIDWLGFVRRRLVDWLIDWVLCVGDWLIDWLIGFCASAIGWLIDWLGFVRRRLVDWLIGYSFFYVQLLGICHSIVVHSHFWVLRVIKCFLSCSTLLNWSKRLSIAIPRASFIATSSRKIFSSARMANWNSPTLAGPSTRPAPSDAPSAVKKTPFSTFFLQLELWRNVWEKM